MKDALTKNADPERRLFTLDRAFLNTVKISYIKTTFGDCTKVVSNQTHTGCRKIKKRIT